GDTDSLTSRQRELLEFIQSTVGHDGRMPSYREMAKALKVAAVGTVQDHLKVLLAKGYLEKHKTQLRLAGARHASIVNVPIVGSVAAGSLRDAFEVASGSMPVSASLLGSKADPSRFFALRVSGESMIDAGILPNDLVVVDRKATVRTGDIAVVDVRGEATVKEIALPRKVGAPLRLIPKNATMKDILVEANEDVRIVGKVISVQRFF
ncbi:MAG: repressor LexA, partial [Bdellovibrionales bacterium]|nr:repressor LexA [Bdellovibrionales bacterium]